MVILPRISRADQQLAQFDQIEADCPLLVVHSMTATSMPWSLGLHTFTNLRTPFKNTSL